MAACGRLQHMFESSLPYNPTLLESLSRNQIKPTKPVDQSSLTEIFGDLHFNESPEASPSSSCVSISPSIDLSPQIDLEKLCQKDVSDSSDIIQTPSSASISSTPKKNHTNRHKSSDSFSSLNSESLQLCTEGLGFESSDEVEDLKAGTNECWETQSEKVAVKKHFPSEDSYGECRRSRVRGGEYPPPISCIGRTGKPWVCFRSYRDNGRFVLKEIRIPTQEFLQAYREDGRLKLHFVLSDDEFLEEEDEEEEEDDAESIDEEKKHDDVGSIGGGEENMEKENDECIGDEVNEEKEVDF